ncbi:TetR/AcrR family transcriptional regulator [Amycolatopsis sp. NPDC059021]|uniref:TetR/AcrR family transcriptional regulator n=1 Tax=Amycolatopsis sp. NPDC059021 TaxID=3346704 RepID=UPI00366C8D42
MTAQSRREQLADAAIDVLATQGGRGLTHRAVDRAAGVPLGTTGNYFPTRQALLLAATERISHWHLAQLGAFGAQAKSYSRATLISSFEEFLRELRTKHRARSLAMLEVHLEAARHPEIRDTLAGTLRAAYPAQQRAVTEGGLPTSLRDVVLLDAFAGGLFLVLLALPAELVTEFGLDDLGALATRLVNTVHRD